MRAARRAPAAEPRLTDARHAPRYWTLRAVNAGIPLRRRGVPRVRENVPGRGCTANPVVLPTETLRSSEKLTIVTGDMELEAPARPRLPSARRSPTTIAIR